jgi:repressor LexA
VARYNDRSPDVLKFIVDFKQSHDGNSPSIREIADKVGLSSSSSVFYYLDRLESAGRIRRNGTRSFIEVTGGRWVYEGEAANG